jgi:hypothetical protein
MITVSTLSSQTWHVRDPVPHCQSVPPKMLLAACSPSQQGCERNALSPAADMLARPPKTARTTPVARSLYLSPSQHPFVGTSRPNSLREALQRNAQAAAPADVSLTPTGLQSALPISLAACRAASLSTPNSRLFRGSPMMPTTVPARPVASPITFVSPSHRLAPAPGLHMRPVLNAPLASGPPRSLAASLACNRNVPGSRWTPKRSLTALLHAAEGTAPSLLHRHHSFASPFEAASAHMPDPATLRPSLQLPLAAVPSVGSNADLGMRPSHDVLRHTQTPAASAALRSPSPPSARPSRRNSSRGLPPTHDRVPQGLAHASSLPRRPSGRAATPILSASPQHSVATPSCLVRPPPLEAPGAPIKRRPDGGDPADLLGRLSSLSVDSIDAGGVPWYHENSQSPPRVTPTRRILCFDSQGAGDVL